MQVQAVDKLSVHPVCPFLLINQIPKPMRHQSGRCFHSHMFIDIDLSIHNLLLNLVVCVSLTEPWLLYICYLFVGSSTYYNLLVFKVFSSNHLKNTLILLFPVAYGGSLLQYAKLTEYSSEITRRISFISFFFEFSSIFACRQLYKSFNDMGEIYRRPVLTWL